MTDYKKIRRRLARKAWEVWSKYIRSKDADFQGYTACYTCLKRFPWWELDAGHFKHTAKKKGLIRTKEIDYDERNVHPQCTRCNRMLHGNLTLYAEFLVRDYGSKILSILSSIYYRAKELTNEELEEIIKRYKS